MNAFSSTGRPGPCVTSHSIITSDNQPHKSHQLYWSSIGHPNTPPHRYIIIIMNSEFRSWCRVWCIWMKRVFVRQPNVLWGVCVSEWMCFVCVMLSSENVHKCVFRLYCCGGGSGGVLLRAMSPPNIRPMCSVCFPCVRCVDFRVCFLFRLRV